MRPRSLRASASRHSATENGTAPWTANGVASGASYTRETSPTGAGPPQPPGTLYADTRHTPIPTWPSGQGPPSGDSTSPSSRGQGRVPATVPLRPPPNWEPPDTQPVAGVPGTCWICQSPLYRWTLTTTDLGATPSWHTFWDLLWLQVARTRGPNWHPMHMEYANRGPCLSEEEKLNPLAENLSNLPPPGPDPPSRLGNLLGILAHTLWFLADEAPGTQRLPQLEAVAASACWPPMAARTLPWNENRHDEPLRAGDIPPLLWEEGLNHRVLPVTRWALQWRLRILPQLSLLGALPTPVKEAFREWAWPSITTQQWHRLWEQAISTGPFPNLLPLTIWTRQVPLQLDHWIRPSREDGRPAPELPRGPQQIWVYLSSRCITRWTCTGTLVRQLVRDAIRSLTSLPTYCPSNTLLVGPHRGRHQLGVPASHPPDLPYPHRDRLI